MLAASVLIRLEAISGISMRNFMFTQKGKQLRLQYKAESFRSYRSPRKLNREQSVQVSDTRDGQQNYYCRLPNKTIQKNGFPYLRNATKKHFGTWFQST